MPDQLTSPRHVLFGLPIDAITMETAVHRCEEAVRRRTPMLVGVVNAAKVVNLRSDRLLRESLQQCTMILADGQSVVWAGRVLGKPLPERVTGIDLFEALLEVADRTHGSIYLLGAKPEVLAELCARIAQRFPGLTIAGSEHGYFRDEDSAEVAERIRAAAPDMLFLGMVSPKKEIFLGTFGDALGVPVMHGVGGSFDILAGVTERAPVAWQRLGLEWAYRLKQEPGRLWRRYMSTNTRFVLLVALERLRPRRPRRSRSGASSSPHSKDS